jgi:hypothetical protein
VLDNLLWEMMIKKLLAVFAAACFAQAAVATDAGDAVNAKNVAKSSVAAASAAAATASAPVPLTDAEMDKVAAGLIIITNFGRGLLFNAGRAPCLFGDCGTVFFRNNPANGATLFKL